MHTSKTTDAWTRVSADEEGLVGVGQGRFVPLSTLHQAMREQFGEDSVTGIFGGQFHFRVQVAAKAVRTVTPRVH